MSVKRDIVNAVRDLWASIGDIVRSLQQWLPTIAADVRQARENTHELRNDMQIQSLQIELLLEHLAHFQLPTGGDAQKRCDELRSKIQELREPRHEAG